MNNAVYRKTKKKLWNIINVRLANNSKDYLECMSKPTYMSHKIFDNNLIVIRKNKVALELSKPAHIGMGILQLSKILMYKFH